MWNDLKYEKSKMAIFILYPKMTQKHNSYANTFDRLECSYTLLFSFKKNEAYLHIFLPIAQCFYDVKNKMAAAQKYKNAVID